MYSARSGSGEAHPEFSRVFGIAACHKRGCFFVPDLHESDLVLMCAQCLHDPVDPIAGKSENDLHSPIHQTLHENVCCCHEHSFINMICSIKDACQVTAVCASLRETSGSAVPCFVESRMQSASPPIL